MSMSLNFWSLLCCIVTFLLFVQNVNSFTNTSHQSHRIPGSNISKYIVSIRTSRSTAYFGDNHFCMGTIISSNIILTAAHCVIDRRKIITRKHRLLVVAGTPNRLLQLSNTMQMKVQDVRPHHNYVREVAHDIAILRLAKSFPDDNDNIKVIPLYDGMILNGTLCYVIGWGRLFYRGPYSAYPLHGTVRVYSYEYCRQFYPDIFDETMLCASNVDTWDVDTCRGDSGSPLICDNQVAGVVSWSSYCGSETKPTVFSSVYHHREWIKMASGTKPIKQLNALFLLLYILYMLHTYIFF